MFYTKECFLCYIYPTVLSSFFGLVVSVGPGILTPTWEADHTAKDIQVDVFISARALAPRLFKFLIS